jgi:hypothetical protein
MPEPEIAVPRGRAFSVRPQISNRQVASTRGAEYEPEYEPRPVQPRFQEGEYAPRAYSVRPEPIRREVVPEYAARAGSIHPGASRMQEYVPRPGSIRPGATRTGSVRPEVYGARPENMPPPPLPRYTSVAPQHSRYEDEDDAPIEQGYSHGRRVVSYR